MACIYKSQIIGFIAMISAIGSCCFGICAQSIGYGSDDLCELSKFKIVDTVRVESRYLYDFSDEPSKYTSQIKYSLQVGENMKLWAPTSSVWLDSVQYSYGKELCTNKLFDEWYEKSGQESGDSYALLGNIIDLSGLKNRIHLGLLDIEFEEEVPRQEWVLEDETRMIGDLECHKAVSDFRGHQWTAWYAPSIPFTEAPWKFSPFRELLSRLQARTIPIPSSCSL